MNTFPSNTRMLTVALLLVPSIHARSFFHEIQEMLDEMHARQKALFQALEQDSLETSLHKKGAKLGLKIEEDKEKSLILAKLSGVEIKGNKPDASLEVAADEQKLTLKVPLNSGTLQVDIHDSLVSASCQIKETTDEKQGSHLFSRNINQARIMSLVPDLETMPSITYEKETKELVIAFQCQPVASKHTKKSVAIQVK